jgi:hypothetical protein
MQGVQPASPDIGRRNTSSTKLPAGSSPSRGSSHSSPTRARQRKAAEAAAQLPGPAAALLKLFPTFANIMTPYFTGQADASDAEALQGRMQALHQRCRQWLEHQQQQQQPADHPTVMPAVSAAPAVRVQQVPAASGGSSSSSSSSSVATRYYSIVDDPLHPEIRQVVQLAMAGLPGWQEDTADMPTSPARASKTIPERLQDDDACGVASSQTPAPTAGSQRGSSSSSVAGPGPSSGPARCQLWDLLWCWSVKLPVAHTELLAWQRVNHFSEARQLARKDLLNKHLAR